MKKRNLAAALRAEIRHHARQEVGKALRRLRRLQRSVAALRLKWQAQSRTLASVQRKMTRLRARVASGRGAAAPGPGGRGASPEAIRSLRQRLRMTREQFARLLGVSPGSIFGWESGRTRPRSRSLARVIEVKKMGVREARSRVMAARRPSRGRRRRQRKSRRG